MTRQLLIHLEHMNDAHAQTHTNHVRCTFTYTYTHAHKTCIHSGNIVAVETDPWR